jgi:hypothetical protein
MGAEAEVASLPVDLAIGDSLLSELFVAPALAASAETLAGLLKSNRAGLTDLDSIASQLRSLLIFGCERCSPDSARLLFGSDRIAVTPPLAQWAKHRYRLAPESSAISLQLAGISFEAESGGECVHPKGGDAPTILDSADRVIDCDGKPFFALLRRGGSEIFLLASSDVLDLNQPSAGGEMPLDAYPRLLPWVLFIRRAAGDRCWRNRAPMASLIIDDPPLRPRYGFLSYAALLESMRRNDFKTTIAFIPWNYSSSAGGTVELFQQSDSALSLCVHGCDHTEAEFGSTNIDELRWKARAALERMKLHQRTTGIGWDPVMVFPQGVFSSASLPALKGEGYLAAVNSGIASVDRPTTNRIADLIAPASIAYGGVPLFKRHYPRSLLPFALDLFLGKQALITEHHTYFRSGYDEAGEFAARLKAIEPRLSWAPLGQTLRGAVQRRVTDSGIELRAYTDEITFKHLGHESERYRLIKRETDPVSVRGVMVNGRAVEYRLADDRIELEIDAHGECRVDVLRRPTPPLAAVVPSFSYRAKVAARRYLSTLRDNALAGNARLLPAPIARRISRAMD